MDQIAYEQLLLKAQETQELCVEQTFLWEQVEQVIAGFTIGDRPLQNVKSLTFKHSHLWGTSSEFTRFTAHLDLDKTPSWSIPKSDLEQQHKKKDIVFRLTQAALQKGQPLKNLESLQFRDCLNLDAECVAQIANAAMADGHPFQNLQTLSFSHCETLAPDSVLRLAEAIRAKGRPLRSLQKLGFMNSPTLAPESVIWLAEAAEADEQPLQNLKALDFRSCPQLAPESIMRLAEAAESGGQPLRNLRSLQFGFCYSLSSESILRLAAAMETESQPLMNLESLDFRHCRLLNPTSIVRLAAAARADGQPLQNLRSLDFQGCEQLEPNSIVSLANAAAANGQPLQSLQTLKFSHCKYLAYDSILRLAETAVADGQPLRNLESLKFYGCTRLAPNSIVKLAEASKAGGKPLLNLKELDFNGCSQLDADSLLQLSEAAQSEGFPLQNLTALGFNFCGLIIDDTIRSLAVADSSNAIPQLKSLQLTGISTSLDSSVLRTENPETIFTAWRDGEERTVVKAAILGKTGRGKTWFCRRALLQEVPTQENAPPTWSFDMHQVDWADGIDGPQAIVADVAGEIHLHGLHNLILDGVELCILVLDDTEVAQAEYDSKMPHAEPKNGNDADYWDGFLKHRMGNRGATVVVRTKCNANGKGTLKADESFYSRFALVDHDEKAVENDPMLIEPFDSQDMTAMVSIEDTQTKLAEAMQRVTGRKTVKGVNEMVEFVRKEFTNQPLVKVEDFYGWCHQQKIGNDLNENDATALRKQVLSVLHHMGELLFFPPQNASAGREPKTFTQRMLLASKRERFRELQNWIFSTTWVTQGLYGVIRSCAQEPVENRGYLTEAEMNEIIIRQFKNKATADENKKLARKIGKVLELTQFCHRSESDQHEARYHFPVMQTRDSSTLINEEGHIDFSLKWGFLDLTAVHQLTVEWFDHLKRNRSNDPQFWIRGMTANREALSGDTNSAVDIELVAHPLKHSVTLRFLKSADPDSAYGVYSRLRNDLVDRLDGAKPVEEPTTRSEFTKRWDATNARAVNLTEKPKHGAKRNKGPKIETAERFQLAYEILSTHHEFTPAEKGTGTCKRPNEIIVAKSIAKEIGIRDSWLTESLWPTIAFVNDKPSEWVRKLKQDKIPKDEKVGYSLYKTMCRGEHGKLEAWLQKLYEFRQFLIEDNDKEYPKREHVRNGQKSVEQHADPKARDNNRPTD